VGISGAVYGDDALFGPCVEQNFQYETPLCYYTPEFSVLWHPFVVPTPVSQGQLIYLGYSVVVGAYLLVPFLYTLGRQMVSTARDAGWLTWKFRW
jgi:hypothetical protein